MCRNERRRFTLVFRAVEHHHPQLLLPRRFILPLPRPGAPPGGYAHIIEDELLFDRSFGVDTLRGIFGESSSSLGRANDLSNRGSRGGKRGRRQNKHALSKREAADARANLAAAFRPFDWTVLERGGAAADAARAAPVADLSMRARFGGGFHGGESDDEGDLNPAPPPGVMGRKIW